MHLLTTKSGFNLLMDCGFDYEKKGEFENRNEHFPFDPKSINAVILTHAHIDHAGNLPNLVKQGFRGPIYTSLASKQLSRILLADSLHIQLSDAAKMNKAKSPKKRHSNFKTGVHKPLYNFKDLENTMDQMQSVPFSENIKLNSEITFRFFPSGHILGAASVKVEVTEENKTTAIGFTGDLGNYNSKLVVDPEVMTGLDYMICESTYGGRLHSKELSAEESLLEHITNTCVKLNGKLIIPAFSVGRTQAILFTLHQLFKKKLLPDIKIFTDSPLAIKSTRLYHEHIEELNDETREFYKKHGNIFEFPNLYVIEDSFSSDLVNHYNEPCIIVSAAGMAEGGRIQEHIRNNIQNPAATILIAGYCAEGTLGCKLLKGQKHIEINRKIKEVYAKVSKTDKFSAHPDHEGILRYVNGVEKAGNLKEIFWVHGDESSQMALKESITNTKSTIPGKGQMISLT